MPPFRQSFICLFPIFPITGPIFKLFSFVLICEFLVVMPDGERIKKVKEKKEYNNLGILEYKKIKQSEIKERIFKEN